jgi:hypothetical protein
MSYDPERAPDPERWLELDDGERLGEVVAYHKKARVKLPNAQLHGIMHVAVETQIAEGYAAATSALDRLIGQGLDRHDAIHAIAAVLSGRLLGVMQGAPEFDRRAYDNELGSLTAERWKKGAG